MAGTTTKKPKVDSKPRPKPTPKPPKPKRKGYTVKIARLWHPDQKIYIDQVPVELKMDSWTEVQLKAGLLIEVEV